MDAVSLNPKKIEKFVSVCFVSGTKLSCPKCMTFFLFWTQKCFKIKKHTMSKKKCMGFFFSFEPLFGSKPKKNAMHFGHESFVPETKQTETNFWDLRFFFWKVATSRVQTCMAEGWALSWHMSSCLLKCHIAQSHNWRVHHA